MPSCICASCRKPQTATAKPLKACARCLNTFYCSPECQTQHWPEHKRFCTGRKPWYKDFRKCKDGNLHEGRLELITWSGRGEGEDMGWGNIVPAEADDLKRKFETEFGGDELKMYNYWPRGFRWTCCGADGEQRWGCDHHGMGSVPCTCDFCKMDKRIPDSIYLERTNSMAGKGLTLSRGPDPRSKQHAAGTIANSTRAMLGMPQ